MPDEPAYNRNLHLAASFEGRRPSRPDGLNS